MSNNKTNTKNYDSKELKECIATAKAVREAAIENAKALLEEEFTSKFTESLASKLKEDIGEDEEVETTAIETPAGDAVETTDTVETEPAVAEGDQAGVVIQVNDAQTGEALPVNGQTPEETHDAAEQAGVTPAEPAAEAPEAEEEPAADATADDAEVPADTETPAEENPEEPIDDQVEDDEANYTDADLEEVLKELADDSDNHEIEYVDKTDDGVKIDKDFYKTEEEEISLDEMLKEIDSELDETIEKKKINTSADITTPNREVGYEKCSDEDKNKVECKDVKAECNVTNEELAEALINAYKINKEQEKQIAEYHAAITEMKTALDESKLFNSKLLYINKLFKNKTLTEKQKNYIYEAFDLAKTDREVKITFALLKESINQASVNKPVKKKNITNSVVSSLTEGLASKPIASTKPSAKIISEATNNLQNRLQQLAGIGFLNQ